MTDITLLYFDACPNWKVAQSRLVEALDTVGRGWRSPLHACTRQRRRRNLGSAGPRPSLSTVLIPSPTLRPPWDSRAGSFGLSQAMKGLHPFRNY